MVAVGLMLFGAAGARFSFGVFFMPMVEEFGWERAQLSLAASVNLLLTGLLRPPAGWLVDRYGGRRIGGIGIVISALALAGISTIHQLWHAYLFFALLAVGYALTSTVTFAPLISRWFVRRRGLALSLTSTGTAMGELTVVPLAMYVLLLSTWQTSYQALAAFLLLVVLPVGTLLIRNSPQEVGALPDGDGLPATGRHRRSFSACEVPPREALGTVAFWQLAFGFFVCGFTMSFAQTHFVPFAMDLGFESMTAASALGVVGGFSIAGSLILGALSDRCGRKNMLALTYLLRALSFLVMTQIHGVYGLFFASFILGISWTATVPLTSAITADRYGLTSLGVIFGSMFTSMPMGSGVGAYLAGLIYDLLGSYQLHLWINSGMGLLAALVVFLIAEEPEVRGEEAPLPAMAEAPPPTGR